MGTVHQLKVNNVNTGAVREPDSDWFKMKLKEAGFSMRKLSRHMEWHPSHTSLILSGKRRLQAWEAKLIGEIIGADIIEIYSRLGVDLAPRTTSQSYVPLVGVVGGDGKISPTTSSRTIDVPKGTGDCEAVQIQGFSGPFDGWIFVFPKSVKSDGLGLLDGSLAVVNGTHLGFVKKAYEPGMIAVDFFGHTTEMEPRTIQPVTLAQP